MKVFFKNYLDFSFKVKREFRLCSSVGEMVWSVSCLSYKHEDLSSNLYKHARYGYPPLLSSTGKVKADESLGLTGQAV